VRRKFALDNFKPYHLRMIYRRHGVTKKQIRLGKKPPGRTAEELRALIRNFNEQVQRRKNSGYAPVFVDEVMVTSSTMLKSTWAGKRAPVTVDRSLCNQPPVACLVAVSAVKGLELAVQYEKSVDKHKFEDFLRQLREKVGERKVVLVLDNLSVHTCKFTQHRMSHHGFTWAYTVPYWPAGNPIEECFAQFKLTFKKLKLQNIVNLGRKCTEELIEKAFKVVTKKLVVNCVKHS